MVFDCRKIIKLLSGTENEASLGSKARRRLVHALFTLNRFAEAEQAAQEWIASCPNGGSKCFLFFLHLPTINNNF